MAEQFVVKAEVRENRGKNDARRLRAAGKVPVIVYGGDGENLSAVAEISDLAAILRSDSGQNSVFSLEVDGFDTTDVMFHDRQIDPLQGRLMHADLRRIRRGEKIEVTVSITLVGDPADEGAVLTQQMREVKILCTPRRIPESIDVDVSGMQVGDSIHVSDLKVEDEVEIHADMEALVASLVYMKEPELEPTPEEELGEPELVGDSTEEDGDKPGAVEDEGDVEKP
ncbi:MAG: 50S ribosomal protein L25 [Pyrinomonadaceae bacterium]|nr:50S ribosomal protein L25 [Pyrinomonadaceae bacterium]